MGGECVDGEWVALEARPEDSPFDSFVVKGGKEKGHMREVG